MDGRLDSDGGGLDEAVDAALSMDIGVDVFVKATVLVGRVDIGEQAAVLMDCVLDVAVVEAVSLGRMSLLNNRYR